MTEFFDKLKAIPIDAMLEKMHAVTPAEVSSLFRMSRVPSSKAAVLFSKAAQDMLEEMAQRAKKITISRFGRTMTFYAPLYLSNYCINQCAYCGFSAQRKIDRKSLPIDQVENEAHMLFDQGIRHLLLVTGEAPNSYGLDRLCEVVRSLRPKAASISVEVFPCDIEGYQRLAANGVDGLVLYQETYLKDVYRQQHPAGPKRDFRFRLKAVEAGGLAGFRSLGIGALLGLAPPMLEGCMMAMHAEYLTRCFPQSRVAISFPRLRPVKGGTPVLHPVGDRDLVQLIVGMRLMFPDAELVLSTRESAHLRDHLTGLGITRMSAGSRTSPGGYADQSADERCGQFMIDDDRSIQEVMDAVRGAGYDVVCKDFDPVLMGTRWPA